MSSPTTPSPAPDDACYRALQTRDARFDGRFFTAVTSTGIYCRPVCKVRCPKRENCRFFALAAQAEQAGFRPCMRCRPELAPQAAQHGDLISEEHGPTVWSVQDASRILAQQAARLLDSPDAWSDGEMTMTALAERLGVSTRHVRRIFEVHWGVSPLQYWQTRRLLTAKQLLTDTPLPVGDIASLSGFASLRRFNDAFLEHYRMQPRALRKTAAAQSAGNAETPTGALTLRAAYRPPLDVDALLQFFSKRQLDGMEAIDLANRCITRTLAIESAGRTHAGWVQAAFAIDACSLTLRISPSLGPVLPTVLARTRAWLDLDADPKAIHAVLRADFPDQAGLRVPGTLDGFELAVRAILGQQITVAAARTLSQRVLQQFGAPVETPFASLNRLFPTPQALAQCDPETLGQLGIVKQRQGALLALARAVRDGHLTLHSAVDVPKTLTALEDLPGIGPWTAQYIALRALRWPDAFPAGDVALHKALGLAGVPRPAQAAELASQRWRPWRSYAVFRAWARLNVL